MEEATPSKKSILPNITFVIAITSLGTFSGCFILGIIGIILSIIVLIKKLHRAVGIVSLCMSIISIILAVIVMISFLKGLDLPDHNMNTNDDIITKVSSDTLTLAKTWKCDYSQAETYLNELDEAGIASIKSIDYLLSPNSNWYLIIDNNDKEYEVNYTGYKIEKIFDRETGKALKLQLLD